MSTIIDDRIAKFIAIMSTEYNWDFTQEETQDVLEVTDKINRSFHRSEEKGTTQKVGDNEDKQDA